MYEGESSARSARQLCETAAAFLQRLPPLTSHVADHGPWIYVANPHTNFRHTTENRRALKEKGQQLLDDFREMKASMEASTAGKTKSIIGKQIIQLRKQLQTDIFAAAKATGCTSGKWMLFPIPDDVNSYWSLVATGTVANELGHAAKVGTDDGTGDRSPRLICIYTDDFEDKEDVKRVLRRLVGMGLVNKKGPMGEGRPIYYKADAFTYLDIMGGNEFGLKPSLYSSKSIVAEGE